MELEKCVYDRVAWAYKILEEDGLMPMGYVSIILGHNEEKLKRDFEFGASEAWLPVTEEFKKWRDEMPRTTQLIIMRTLFEDYELKK